MTIVCRTKNINATHFDDFKKIHIHIKDSIKINETGNMFNAYTVNFEKIIIL